MSAPQHRNSPKLQHAADRQFDVFPSYKGGPTTTRGGYIHEFVGEHPLANMWGFVAQHRLVASDTLGRPLQKGEVVHHKDNCRTNNAPANLEVMTQAAHRQHHWAELADLLRIPLDETEVSDLLQETRSVKGAARLLGCSHSTLRLRFPELCAPFVRSSPLNVLSEVSPAALKRVLRDARDPNTGLRTTAQAVNMSYRTILRLCAKHGVVWAKKRRSDTGGRHRKPSRSA